MLKIGLKATALLSLFFLFFLQESFAQSKTITGRVIDDKGNPVAGASVVVKGMKNGTATDSSGNFSLAVPAAARQLLVSSVGFGSVVYPVGTGSGLVITITAEGASLNDVVVVGYGTARRKDVTGSVASIGAKDFNQGAITTPMDQVQGKVPGLVVTTADGDPNGNPQIRLRGQTSLLGFSEREGTGTGRNCAHPLKTPDPCRFTYFLKENLTQSREGAKINPSESILCGFAALREMAPLDLC